MRSIATTMCEDATAVSLPDAAYGGRCAERVKSRSIVGPTRASR